MILKVSLPGGEDIDHRMEGLTQPSPNYGMRQVATRAVNAAQGAERAAAVQPECARLQSSHRLDVR